MSYTALRPRNPAMLPALVAAWFCFAASPASAQVCTSGDDCAEGEHCDLPPQPAPGCKPGETCPEPEPVEGRCEADVPDDVECTSDDDCEGGFQCVKGASTPGCDPSGGSCADAGVKVAETGYCEPKPIACDTSADCPEALSCESDGGSGTCTSLRDGGTLCEPDMPEEKRCVYAPTECDADDDCDAAYACTVLGSVEECSGGGFACNDGEDCPAPEPETCTRRDVKACFPERVDCEVDADCALDWRCVEIPEDARGAEAPAGWQDATSVCFPEGLALVADGRVEGRDLGSFDASGGGAGAPTREGKTASSDGGWCSVGRAGTQSSRAAGLTALGVLVGLALRRRVRG